MAEANKEQRIGVDLGLMVGFQVPADLKEALTCEMLTYALREAMTEYLTGLLFSVAATEVIFDKASWEISVKIPKIPVGNASKGIN